MLNWKWAQFSTHINKLNESSYVVCKPFKITHKLLLKWKSSCNKSRRSRKTEQKWYLKVFCLRPGRGRKIEFTELNLELWINYENAIDLSSRRHPYAASRGDGKPLRFGPFPPLFRSGYSSWPRGRAPCTLGQLAARHDTPGALQSRRRRLTPLVDAVRRPNAKPASLRWCDASQEPPPASSLPIKGVDPPTCAHTAAHLHCHQRAELAADRPPRPHIL